MKTVKIREEFYPHNIKDTTKQIRWQLDNIDRFVDGECIDHNLIEFIDWIETCTKHLRYMLIEKESITIDVER